MARGTCEQCSKRYPEVRVDTYYGAGRSFQICDDCLYRELRKEATPARVTYAPGARYLVNPDGSESEFPSYAS